MFSISSRSKIVPELSKQMDSLPKKCPVTPYDTQLKIIFDSDSSSLREVALIILVAKAMDDDYNPNADFYACKPRSLAENELDEFFNKYKIPHTTSAPLNILKAATINESWCSQRRDKVGSKALLEIAKYVANKSPANFDNFLISVLFRFKELADKSAACNTPTVLCNDPVSTYKALKIMIDEATDSGNTPQQIVSLLLDAYYTSIGLPKRLDKGADSAFVTNATSKKPGDLLEIDSEGRVCKIYEVTVKKFDKKRLEDSVRAVLAYDNGGQPMNEVIVLCREEDAQVGDRIKSPCIAKIVESGITYVFQDIYNWLFNQLMSMPDEARSLFFQKFGEYINRPKTPIPVKQKWGEVCKIYFEGDDAKFKFEGKMDIGN